MLCTECDNICLQLDESPVNGTLLRQYDNLPALRSTAISCELCELFEDSMAWLHKPGTAPYCRSCWGEDLWLYLLANSSISAYHITDGNGDHNIEIRGGLDAEHAPVYVQGPRRLRLDTLLGGICVEEDSPHSYLVRGRPAEYLKDKRFIVQALRTQYDTCLAEHSKCGASSTLSSLPARLLKIDQGRVVVTHVGPKSEVYATLSYCWGKSNTVQLTSDTLDQYTIDGIAFDELPRTIREALELCVGINIQYLWVDCLCILQDSVTDWASASASMAMIYNTSALNIKASAGADSEYGLFRDRGVRTQKNVEMQCQDKRGTVGSCKVRGPLYYNFRGAADERAWVLQEDLLSRRVVSFTPDQLNWQCCSSAWTESGAVVQYVSRRGWIFPRPLLKASEDFEGSPQQDSEHSRLWESVVYDYCARLLTIRSDKLPALSGIAHWYKTHSSLEPTSRYLAGLWEAHLPGNLLWYHAPSLPDYAVRSYVPISYIAPSWSWAANNGPYLQWLDWRKQLMLAKVTRTDLALQDGYEFGRVQDASLIICGPVKRGAIVQEKHYKEYFGFCEEDTAPKAIDFASGRHDSALGRTYFDSIEYNKAWLGYDSTPDHASWTCECLRISETAGLLIEAIDKDSMDGLPAYRRIGLVRFHSSEDEWWLSSTEVSIQLF